MIDQTDLTEAGIAEGSIYLTPQKIFSTIIAVTALLEGLVQLISDLGLNSSIPGKMDCNQALFIRG